MSEVPLQDRLFRCACVSSTRIYEGLNLGIGTKDLGLGTQELEQLDLGLGI